MMVYQVVWSKAASEHSAHAVFTNYSRAKHHAAALAKSGFGVVNLDKHNRLTGRCEPMAEWINGKTQSIKYGDPVICRHHYDLGAL